MGYEYKKSLSDLRFRQVVGVKRETFEEMVSVLKTAHDQKIEKRGRHKKLTPEDTVLAMLEYFREYRSYDCIGASYGLSKPNIYKAIKWAEEELIKSGLFRMPGKKSLLKSDAQWEVVIVDTTETPIQRPSKGQKAYYSGKKNDIR